MSVGLYHSAFEASDVNELLAAVESLEALQHGYQLIDHGISWAVYSSDPDGNGVEVYLDRRGAPSGAQSWHGTSRRLAKEAIEREALEARRSKS